MKYQILHNLTSEYIEALRARFWAKVDTSGGPNACWEWQGAKNLKGYGSIGVNGKTQLSHRTSFELFIGPIPSRHYVCHKCDNPSCVNPSHFFAGTNSDNVNDAIAKGRLSPSVIKLQPKQVRTLRNNFNQARHTLSMWAGVLDVSEKTVSDTLKGMSHKRVGGPIHTGSLAKSIPVSQFETVKRLYKNGYSGLQIADKLNIGKSSVYRILKDQQRVSAL